MIPLFRAIRTSVADIQRLQESLSKVFNGIQTKQIIDGRLLTDVSLFTGQINEVNHGLGKPYRGWIIVDKDADANVYVTTQSQTPNATILFQTSADVIVSLWLF